MTHNTKSPWSGQEAANDNEDAPQGNRGNRTQVPAVICDLPSDPGIIEGEADLLARYFHLILDDPTPANDNEATAED